MPSPDIVGCIDCDIAAGRRQPLGGVILHNEHWMLNHAVAKILGHLVLKPRIHVEHVGDVDEAAMTEFGPLTRRICRALTQECLPDKVYVASFGEIVQHVHFHFIPRYSWMPTHATPLLQAFDAGEYSCTEDEVEELADKLRRTLNG